MCKKTCDWDGVAAPEMKQRMVRGLMGKGTSAAVVEAGKDDRADACAVCWSETDGWLQRIDQGQDETNILLGR
jgi:hypothetical protein